MHGYADILNRKTSKHLLML